MNAMWDQEIATLEQDIVQLTKQASKLPDPRAFEAVVVQRQFVDESLGAFVVNHDRLLQVARKANKLSRGHAVVLYWAKQHMTKMKILADEFLSLQNRKMWLRLLQARFAGSAGSNQRALEAKHLVDLVVRRQQLARVEKALQEDLESVAENRRQLKQEYQTIATADQNWAASGSMYSRLGVDLENVADNPSVRALSDYMKTLSIPLRHPAEDSRLVNLNNELDSKSASLLTQCKDLAGGFVLSHAEAVNRNTLNQFKHAINQVEDLNRETSRKINRLKNERFQPARPKVVPVEIKKPGAMGPH